MDKNLFLHLVKLVLQKFLKTWLLLNETKTKFYILHVFKSS